MDSLGLWEQNLHTSGKRTSPKAAWRPWALHGTAGACSRITSRVLPLCRHLLRQVTGGIPTLGRFLTANVTHCWFSQRAESQQSTGLCLHPRSPAVGPARSLHTRLFLLSAFSWGSFHHPAVRHWHQAAVPPPPVQLQPREKAAASASSNLADFLFNCDQPTCPHDWAGSYTTFLGH